MKKLLATTSGGALLVLYLPEPFVRGSRYKGRMGNVIKTAVLLLQWFNNFNRRIAFILLEWFSDDVSYSESWGRNREHTSDDFYLFLLTLTEYLHSSLICGHKLVCAVSGSFSSIFASRGTLSL